MTVPFLDVGASYVELRDEIDHAVHRVLSSGWYILGDEVEAFETEFAQYAGARHCVGVASGLDALRLGLAALDIGEGDDVLVPGHTFIATWLAVTAVGARPIPVEPDLTTYNIDPARLRDALTPATKAIIPVHLYGQPAELETILDFARREGLEVLGDAAQAHGARYQGSPVGSYCHSAWSFYPGKNLGAYGDGGAVTTDDAEIADRLRLLRNYGSAHKYEHAEAGLNSRLDELQAAVLRVKLRHLDEWNDRRRRIAGEYLRELADLPLALPRVHSDVDPVWHLFVVRSPDRGEVLRHLQRADIGTGIHYPTPPHLQRAFDGLAIARGSLPVCEELAGQVLSLPIGPHLDEPQVRAVIDAVRDACRNTTPGSGSV